MPPSKAAWAPVRAAAAAFQQGDFASAFSDVFDDLFGDIMGGRGGGGGRQRASRGSDLRYNLRIKLEDAYRGHDPDDLGADLGGLRGLQGHRRRRRNRAADLPDLFGHGQGAGAERLLHRRAHLPDLRRRRADHQEPLQGLPRRRPDREGAGAVSVNIPAGVETGTRIRLAGEGEAGMRGGPSGDLYIFIEVEEHPIFQREATNLYCRVPVSMASAALGGDIEVPTIDGGRSRVKIPPGSQSGTQMRLRSKGMPALRGGAQGDMFIELAVETPVNLTSRQRELLREFEREATNNSPESAGFFAKVKGFWDGMKG